MSKQYPVGASGSYPQSAPPAYAPETPHQHESDDEESQASKDSSKVQSIWYFWSTGTSSATYASPDWHDRPTRLFIFCVNAGNWGCRCRGCDSRTSGDGSLDCSCIGWRWCRKYLCRSLHGPLAVWPLLKLCRISLYFTVDIEILPFSPIHFSLTLYIFSIGGSSRTDWVEADTGRSSIHRYCSWGCELSHASSDSRNLNLSIRSTPYVHFIGAVCDCGAMNLLQTFGWILDVFWMCHLVN